jgi:hypothetical protein
MSINFNIGLSGTDFEFISMNRVRPQLYQVYVHHEGKRRRFHLQIEEDGNFHMKDRSACPEIYLALETTMSDAIKQYGTGHAAAPVEPVPA